MTRKTTRGTTIWFVTGATGLLGGATLGRLLADDRHARAVALVRDAAQWPALARQLGAVADRVEPVVGDVTVPGLALGPALDRRLAAEVTGVLHCAADTTFSRPLDDARLVNTEGTRHLLDAAAGWPGAGRFVHVSTAFVAGRRTGMIAEDADAPDAGASDAGWVNGYEQSKAEAEALVRSCGGRWLIVRPSTVVCDDASGRVSQPNAVHRALRLYHHGLAAMMPHAPGAVVDLVPADYVAGAIARLAPRTEVAGVAVQLCAGAGALPLEELLDATYGRWARDEGWRRRGVARPALADLETYQLFERTVEETGDRRLRQVLRSLSHFVPQLALPKQFDTRRSDALVGAAPAVRSYWPRVLDALLASRWSGVAA